MSSVDKQLLQIAGQMIQHEEGEYEEGTTSEMDEGDDKEPARLGPNDTITLDGLLLCPFPGCLKDFSTRWSLNRHSRVHSGVKPYKCAYCTKDFAQNCSLKRHEQTHTQERQWVCSYPNCGKRFKLKEYLEVHHQRSHPKDELVEAVQIPEDKPDVAIQAVVDSSTATIDQLRERLVRMSVRHHDQLYFHQEREQQLIYGLQECSSALDRALHIILAMHGGDPHAVPVDLLQIGQKYSTQRYTPLGPPAVPPLPVPYGYPSPFDVSMSMQQHAIAAQGFNRVTPTAASMPAKAPRLV
eukprot:gene14930-17124_t